jgi:hypothetical protein
MAEHQVKLFLDTSIYIPFVNHGIAHPAIELPQGPPLIYMSAVVMEKQSVRLCARLPLLTLQPPAVLQQAWL